MLKKLIQIICFFLCCLCVVCIILEVIGNNQYFLCWDQFSWNVVKVVEIFQWVGYQVYVVGGCVCDQMFGIVFKDFDVVISVMLEQVCVEFCNVWIIGCCFKLVYVYFGCEIIEVVIFCVYYLEGQDDGDSCVFSNESGCILCDNVYGSLEDDVQCCDFIINVLYFDVISEWLLDYVNGVYDICNCLICLIGDLEQCYLEDLVWMLWVVCFVVKFDFEIEKYSVVLICWLVLLLWEIFLVCLFDEVFKLFFVGWVECIFELLVEYELFVLLFLVSVKVLQVNFDYIGKLICQVLVNIDVCICQGKLVILVFFFVVLFWLVLLVCVVQLQEKGMLVILVMQEVVYELISEQCQWIVIFKCFILLICEIWDMQECLL